MPRFRLSSTGEASTHVVLDAPTPEGRGYQHGAALRIPIRKAMREFKRWARVTAGLEDGDFAIHTNHSLQVDAPRTFEMTAGSGGGSPALTFERLELAQKLIWNVDTMALRGFQELFRTRPILVHPGKPTGRTLMNMIAEIPAEGSPTLYITPDAPHLHEHAHFEF